MEAIRVCSPYAVGRAPASLPRDPVAASLPVDTVSIADAPPPSHSLARGAGLALLVGLSLAGVAAPAMAAEPVPPPPTSVATTVAPKASRLLADIHLNQAGNGGITDVPAPGPGDLFPQLPTLPGVPDIPLPSLPTIPKPDSTPDVPVHVNTTGDNYFTLSSRSRFSERNSYTFGEADFGRKLGLQVDKGPWHSDTRLDLGGSIRLGARLDPGEPAGNFTGGARLSEKLSHDLGGSDRLYGRAQAGIQGGFGTRFSADDPLNAFRIEGAVGVEHRMGTTLLYGEPFVEHVQDLTGHLGHDQYGVRAGAEHRLSESQALSLELKASHYDYTDGRSTPAYGVRVGYERKDGRVWWGPQVGFEHRDNHDNRVTVGVQFNF